MRAFVTGGTGFLGGRLARRLRDRGDEVVALARSRGKAESLVALDCEVVEGDLGRIHPAWMDGCDVVIHAAAVYRVGVTADEAEAMRDANVGGTERVIDGAVVADVGRVVYVSTINVFGDTRGSIVDEGYRRDLSAGFLSVYDETKYRAYEAAMERAVAGFPS